LVHPLELLTPGLGSSDVVHDEARLERFVVGAKVVHDQARAQRSVVGAPTRARGRAGRLARVETVPSVFADVSVGADAVLALPPLGECSRVQELLDGVGLEQSSGRAPGRSCGGASARLIAEEDPRQQMPPL
jgi:hypothetical protein